MAALLGLFWRLLREGRLKVARGRSWQPEIGMEHASRGRRSGNKGVGARWRGRFRIFSARHCSRTKVSHAFRNDDVATSHRFVIPDIILTENAGGEVESCRGSPRLAWSMIRAWEPAGVCWGDIFRSRTKVSHAENSGMTMGGLWPFVLRVVAGAGMRSGASRDAFPRRKLLLANHRRVTAQGRSACRAEAELTTVEMEKELPATDPDDG